MALRRLRMYDIANAQFAEIPGTGHLTMQADDNNKSIEEFFR
jgi:hypothetical protein